MLLVNVFSLLILQLTRDNRYLDLRGCALKNMPSLPQVTVVGAICTASHGSGEE